MVRASDSQCHKSQLSWVRSQNPPDTVESEGRHMKQCWISHRKRKNPKNPPGFKCFGSASVPWGSGSCNLAQCGSRSDPGFAIKHSFPVFQVSIFFYLIFWPVRIFVKLLMRYKKYCCRYEKNTIEKLMIIFCTVSDSLLVPISWCPESDPLLLMRPRTGNRQSVIFFVRIFFGFSLICREENQNWRFFTQKYL